MDYESLTSIDQLHNHMKQIQEAQPSSFETKADETIHMLKTQSEIKRLEMEKSRVAFLQKVREYKNGK